MRKLFLFFSVILSVLASYGAGNVDWSYKLIGDNTQDPSLEITARIERGFHLYAFDNPAMGANPLVMTFEVEGCKLVGKPTPNKAYSKEYNDIFGVEEHFWSGSVTFVQKLKATAPTFTAKVEIQGQVCNDGSCVQVFGSHKFEGKSPVAAKEDPKDKGKEKESENVEAQQDEAAQTTEEKAEEVAEMVDSLQSSNGGLVPGVNLSDADTSDWWANVEAEFKVFEENPEQQSRSLWYIFIAGFLGGLIALVTPCVWPMIPMTVSFFLKQNKTRKKSIAAAVTYGVSIIVIYVLLGLLVTVIFGASALNELATSAGFNIAFFLLLVLFAISFMGGFEITLPSSWSNKMDSKVDSTTGYLSIFFMAFTLALVSFSCTGPIIGTLLVEAAATSNFISPAVGMAGFSIALALPFTLFAIFPTILKSVPKSGGWMNTVKVVLGFLELALALKFLSVADLAYGWRILDREVFISLWIVIFGLLGVYLLGKITFPHDSKLEKISVPRFMLACISLAFAVYMIPGLWGAPLKSISAFAPPVSTQDFNLYDGSVHASSSDYEEGMRMARDLRKPVMIDFSGYGCVNCRKMEAAVWTNPEVKSIIENDYVLITLMVDDKKPLPSPIKVTEKDGTERTLRTYGDKWSYLERTKFGANAQPYYVLVDNNGKPIAKPYSYDENVTKYLQFLRSGLERYKSLNK
ncbi:MAG: thioredoxin family protein [Muribaculaceae bacterium]|nr:thioredoxin family protein [Muribaculaceae bacterium]